MNKQEKGDALMRMGGFLIFLSLLCAVAQGEAANGLGAWFMMASVFMGFGGGILFMIGVATKFD